MFNKLLLLSSILSSFLAPIAKSETCPSDKEWLNDTGGGVLNGLITVHTHSKPPDCPGQQGFYETRHKRDYYTSDVTQGWCDAKATWTELFFKRWKDNFFEQCSNGTLHGTPKVVFEESISGSTGVAPPSCVQLYGVPCFLGLYVYARGATLVCCFTPDIPPPKIACGVGVPPRWDVKCPINDIEDCCDDNKLDPCTKITAIGPDGRTTPAQCPN